MGLADIFDDYILSSEGAPAHLVYGLAEWCRIHTLAPLERKRDIVAKKKMSLEEVL